MSKCSQLHAGRLGSTNAKSHAWTTEWRLRCLKTENKVKAMSQVSCRRVIYPTSQMPAPWAFYKRAAVYIG